MLSIDFEKDRITEQQKPLNYHHFFLSNIFLMTQGMLFAMPLIVINMGGEMTYILEQRLRAQKISPDKSTKGIHASNYYF